MLSRRHLLRLGGVALLVPGSSSREARGGDVIDFDVIANKKVSFSELSKQEIAAVFTRAIRMWGGYEMLRPFNFRPGSPERLAFDRVILQMDPDQSAQLWIDKMVRGEGEPPRKVNDALTMLKVVAALPGGLGYLRAGLADASVKVVARVRDGKVEKP
jgi:hypothetical protein